MLGPNQELVVENEMLRETIRQLKELMAPDKHVGGALVRYRGLHLTYTESLLLTSIVRRGTASRASLVDLLDLLAPEQKPHVATTVSVNVAHLREKLAAVGVELGRLSTDGGPIMSSISLEKLANLREDEEPAHQVLRAVGALLAAKGFCTVEEWAAACDLH